MEPVGVVLIVQIFPSRQVFVPSLVTAHFSVVFGHRIRDVKVQGRLV